MKTPHDQAPVEVFWGSGSQPSWRVLLALEVKGIPYASRLISFSAGDHKTPEFLAMNPRHKVPVLRHGEFTIYESRAILAYLDRAFPEVPLFGETPQEAGLVARHIAEMTHYFEPAIMNYVRPLFFGKQDDLQDQVVAAVPRILEEARPFGAALSQSASGWLVGERISAADIFAYPTLKALHRALAKPAAVEFDLTEAGLHEAAPALPRWMERVEQLPGYDNTYPPHWRG